MGDEQDFDIRDFAQKVADAFTMMQGQYKEQCDRIDRLEDLLTNGVIKGIQQLALDDQRSQGVSGLQKKYGDQISSLGNLDDLGLSDWGDKLYDHLNDMKNNSADWNDDMESGEVGRLVEGLKGHLAKIAAATGKPASASVTKVDAVPVEGEVSAAPEAKPEEDELLKKVASVRGKMSRTTPGARAFS